MLVKLPDQDRHWRISSYLAGGYPASFDGKATPGARAVNASQLDAGQAFRAINPPSTGITAPVRNDAAGRHRLSVMCATSSGSP
ncbi:hypothetical protein BraRD5C2_05120 [Bradyrhizobium sp. RD5-C2]|nr:hypothetical protein BraRD5C2_05120 [Bradyrhizobium sp. RD5-C2]